MGTRDKLKEFSKRRYKTVPIDGFGDVTIQSLTEAEWTGIVMDSQNGHRNQVNAMLIRATIVNERHRREYADTDDDLAEILALDSKITAKLADEITRHIQPKEIEELVGNSEQTREGSGPSD